MRKCRGNVGDVQFWLLSAKRKRPITTATTATTATSEYLVAIHEQHPRATIRELRDLLSDRRRYIPDPEALAVLDAYIKAGEGETVPRWW